MPAQRERTGRNAPTPPTGGSSMPEMDRICDELFFQAYAGELEPRRGHKAAPRARTATQAQAIA